MRGLSMKRRLIFLEEALIMNLDPKEKFFMVLDYLFGKDVSQALLTEELKFTYSRRTGRVKAVFMNNELLVTFRPDGGLALTIQGAKALIRHPNFIENCVVVRNEVKDFVARGRSVFVKHMIRCGSRIRPGSEVVILDGLGNIIAVGKALLSVKMMVEFKEGVAVKVREGCEGD